MVILTAFRRFIGHTISSSADTGRAAAIRQSFSNPLFVLCIFLSFLILAACSSSWSPSDDESLKLVKNYYLFYHEGKQVEARITKRHPYSKDCDCVPIGFRVKFPDREGFIKVFYFFKNEAGETDIRVHRFGLRH